MATNVLFDRNIGREISKTKWLFKSNLRYLAIYYIAVHPDVLLYLFNGTVQNWNKNLKTKIPSRHTNILL